MKPIKAFGLVALAALMAMALAGTSSAMAESTALCAVDPGAGPEEVCPEEELIEHVHASTTAEIPSVILTSIGNVVCSVLYLADTVELLSSPLVLEGTFTYAGCTAGCSVTEENGPSEIKLLKLGHEKADAKLEFLIHVKCNGFINCNYRGEEMKGFFKGLLLPFIEEEDFGNTELKKENGFLCPNQAFLDLLVFSLEAFHITK